MSKSWYDHVADFTEAAADDTLPTAPKAMTRKEWAFLKKMIADEISEIDKAFVDYENACNASNNKGGRVEAPDSTNLIAEQADGLVDIVYYICDGARKAGISLTEVFDAVHSANMTKVDPETGKCKKRADGKILKPEGFVAPDIKSIINKQSVAGLKISNADFDLNRPFKEVADEIKAETEDLEEVEEADGKAF